MRSAFEAQRRHVPPIAPSQYDPADYDLVAIGTPVWTASVSSPVRAYLQRNRGALRKAAFFCTCGGSGSRRAFAEMKEESGVDPVARLLREDDVGTVAADLAIERFASALVAPAAQALRDAPPGGAQRDSAEGSRAAH